jgi:hypothetical protein
MADEVEHVGAAYLLELRKGGTFAVVVEDEVVRLDDLTALELAGVQRATGVAWTDLLEHPTADLLGAVALIEACEAHAGAQLRSGGMTVGELLDRFVHLPAPLEVVAEADAGRS